MNTSTGIHPTLGISIYNFEPFKSIQPSDYNLLNIEQSEDHPYFFGLGMSSRYNCNAGFKNVEVKPLKKIKGYNDRQFRAGLNSANR